MNPSGRGWITKLLKLIESGHGGEFGSLEDLYLKLREVLVELRYKPLAKQMRPYIQGSRQQI